MDILSPTDEENLDSELLETFQQEALRNSEVLKIVANNCCHVRTLKNSRLVNRLWNYVMSTELLTRDCLEVRLKFYESDNKFYRDLSNCDGQYPADLFLSHDYSLPLLGYWLEFAQLFPSATFTFNGGDLGSEDCLEFFRIVGPRLGTLSLNSVSSTSKETLQKLFTDDGLNIHTLKIHNDYFHHMMMSESWTGSPSEDRLWLPSLKCLILDPTCTKGRPAASPLVKVFVKGAPNLQKVYNFSIADIDTFVQSGKVQTIQDVSEFGNLALASLSSHTEFSKAQPTALKKICLKLHTTTTSTRENNNEAASSMVVATVLEAFTKILNSSQKVLKELTILDDSNYSMIPLRIIQIPSLEKLTRLSLFKKSYQQLRHHRRRPRRPRRPFDFGRHHFDDDDDDDDDNEYLPADNNDSLPERPPIMVTLGSSYPKLKFLAIGPVGLQSLNHGAYLPSVRTIEVPHDFKISTLFTNSVQNICPNFRTLRLSCGVDDRDWQLEETIRDACRRLTFLHCLEIIVPRLRPRDFQNLDSAFTGMERPACRRFHEESPTVVVPNFQQFRKYPWLGCIIDLRNLNIFFESSVGWKNIRSYCSPPLTSSSGLYAFELLPNLTVTIGYDTNDQRLEQCLKSVSPFVNFIQL